MMVIVIRNGVCPTLVANFCPLVLRNFGSICYILFWMHVHNFELKSEDWIGGKIVPRLTAYLEFLLFHCSSINCLLTFLVFRKESYYLKQILFLSFWFPIYTMVYYLILMSNIERNNQKIITILFTKYIQCIYNNVQ